MAEKEYIEREDIRSKIKREINPYGKPTEKDAYGFGLDLMNYIDRMPTADVVQREEVEQLKIERNNYKAFYDRVANLPDCNDCGKKPNCEYLPRYGDNTRINCPLWEAELKKKYTVGK